jgi:large subunit ribosomal protein L17
MYKRRNVKKLGRTKSHRDALMMNQLRNLFKYGYVKTTSPKAHVLKGKAESLIAEYSDSVSFRRKAGRILGTKELVDTFTEYAKKPAKKVRIYKIGFRAGDMGEVSKVELVDFKEKKTAKKEEVKKDSKKEKKMQSEKNVDKKQLERRDQEISAKKIMKVNRERAKSRSGL